MAITEASDGQRIDNFLVRELKGVPRSRIYRLLRKGEVRVNGKRVQPTYRLRPQDSVRLPPVRLDAPPVERTTLPDALVERLRQGILHEDEGLLVLNKPAGLAVHGGSGLRYGLIEALRMIRPNETFLELVHRLDRDTSGVLLIARKRSALRDLHDLLRTGGVEKRYLVLLAGLLPEARVAVDAPLDRSEKAAGGQVRVKSGGKASRSEFRRLQVFRGPDCTLAEVEIDTGRTHQIRVHAAHIGRPVVGDAVYGDHGINKQFRAIGLKRLFLHAQTLAFKAANGEQHLFTAQLADDLRAVIDRLESPR
ncbi:MAG: RluA family pseudouridine synthase [Aquisalimonadaceae bacterium]